MFLTRMGRNAKFVITGDVTQIDLPRHQQSGLVQATRILDGINGISIIQLDNSDVIRHKLVTKIIRAYDRADASKAAETVDATEVPSPSPDNTPSPNSRP
jgi:phosphate starvation-inducible PhoH-like protein